MMANPFEYRDTMWALLHDGNLPAKDDDGYEPGGDTPQSAFDEMRAMQAAAIAARETNQA